MGVMDIGASALRTAYTRLQTTSHNIANASTPGYSRQDALVEARASSYSGSGFLGGGVSVMTVERTYSQHLTRELNSATAQQSADKARADALSRLDSLFADSENGIGARYDSLNASLADMVNQPYDESARTVAMQRAGDLAQSLSSTDSELARLSDDSALQAKGTITDLNARLKDLAALNNRIGAANGSLHSPNDLLDQRDALIEKINGSIKVSTHINEDQTASLFASTGDALVLKQDAAVLGLDTDSKDPDRLRVTVEMGNNVLPLKDELITGGALAGQLQFHNDDLRAARARIGQLAGSIAEGYNRQQALGVDADGIAGGPLFQIGAGQAVAATTNDGDATFEVTMADGSALKASDYKLELEGGAYKVTRLSDDTETILSTLPDTVDGVRFELTGGAMAEGDSFAIRTGTAFASGFAMRLASPDDWATAYPAVPSLGADNQGSVAIADFAVTDVDANVASPVTISFQADGRLAIDGGSGGPLTDVEWTSGEPVEVNGWSITLTGTPQAGDTVTVGATKDLSADNRNARALLALSENGMVDGLSASDAVGAMVGEIGSRSQAANNLLTQSESWATGARAARDEVSGVNLDEEAARLLQYQQSYQAAAKVIATAQNMFDSLLSIAG